MKIDNDLVAGWDGLRMPCGKLSLGLVPVVGGRIMSLTFEGEELFFFPEKGVKKPDLVNVTDLPTFKKNFGFPLFGGDKTWVAPENEWLSKSPPVDLDAGAYSWALADGEIVMESQVCRETGLQITRRISLLSDHQLRLVEQFRNASSTSVRKGIWNVTQLRRPFDVYFPARIDSLRSYHQEDPTLPDPGSLLSSVSVGHREWTKVSCRSAMCFKCGGIPDIGEIVAVKPSSHGGFIAFHRSFQFQPNAVYAHRSAVEVFNSALFDYGEVEVHGPLTALSAGDTTELTQIWSFERIPSEKEFHRSHCFSGVAAL